MPSFKPETEKSILHCLLLVLAIFIPYHQVAQHRFIEFDDGLYTFLNTYIVNGLNWESVVWAFTNTDAANWHPLTWITHLIDRELFTSHPGGYLLMNVAWHTATACLCYLAFYCTTKRRLFSLTVALIFAIHPANVENVAWTSERKSLIDGFFWFLGIIAYIHLLETRQRKYYGIVIITHILGLMAKAMHVTFPCTLVLIHLLHTVSTANGSVLGFADYRKSILHSLKLVWPLLLLSAYFSVVTASAQTVAMSSMETHSIAGRIINALQAYQKYIVMFFNPNELAPFYPLFFSELKTSTAILPTILLLSITILLAAVAKKRPVALLGWFWFLGTMVPVIGLVQVGSQSHADRYLYIPMIGLCFVFPELFATLQSWSLRGIEKFHSGWLLASALSLGVATYIQVGYWKDGVVLFQHSLRVTGDCLTSVNCLACAYLRNERFAEAIIFLDQKISIAQNPYNIGKFYTLQAQAHLALKQSEKAAECAKLALANGREEATVYWVLANAYFQLNKPDEAKEAITKAKALLTQPNQMMLVELQIQNGIIYFDDLLSKSFTSNSAGVSK